MPTLKVTNLKTVSIDIQDPAGLSAQEIHVPASATSTDSVAADYLARIEPQLKALATGSDITYTVTDDASSLADNASFAVRIGLVSPITALATDEIVISKLTTPGAVSVVLPSALPIGAVVDIVDGAGDGATHNITIDPEGSDTINGGATLVISANYGRKKCIKIAATAWIGV